MKRKIGIHMLHMILPVIIVGLGLLTYISANTSSNIIQGQTQKQMELNLEGQKAKISSELSAVEAMTLQTASVVGNTYETTSLKEYEAYLTDVIGQNDLVLGSGIWFEPYVYDKDEEYVGPYVFKDGDKIETTYDYSNAEYNYFSYEFYTGVANGEKKAVIKDPYYDEVSGTVMASCSAPIYSSSDTFIGVITVDIELTAIQNIVSSIDAGTSSSAFLLNSAGQYLYTEDTDKILSTGIDQDTNQSLAAQASTIIQNDSGILEYEVDGAKYNLYYDTLEDQQWILGISISQRELNASVLSLLNKLIIIVILVLVVVVIDISWQISGMAKEIKNVHGFAEELSDGNFSVPSMDVKRRDELGAMGHALNKMYENTKNIIEVIDGHSKSLSVASEDLNQAADHLNSQFDNIEGLIESVNCEMTSTSAATEEVNASVEEVNSSVNLLTEETRSSKQLAGEIMGRAREIEKSSMDSVREAEHLVVVHQKNLEESIRNADVVKSIGELASAISDIADEINLLSLNASIEAARAGEQGKGFAVVASEIGNLAGDTAKTVEKIQATIADVQNAFDVLVENSQSMLGFVNDKVKPDYDSFVEVAQRYGQDAGQIEDLTNQIAEMTQNIESIITEVSSAVANIAESSQHTVENGDEMMQSVAVVSKVVSEIAIMSEQQEVISGEITEVVNRFKLS